MATGSRAKVYADVNVHKPREYWDYENLTIHWGCAPLAPPLPQRSASLGPSPLYTKPTGGLQLAR